jgi:hypothetical protein
MTKRLAAGDPAQLLLTKGSRTSTEREQRKLSPREKVKAFGAAVCLAAVVGVFVLSRDTPTYKPDATATVTFPNNPTNWDAAAALRGIEEGTSLSGLVLELELAEKGDGRPVDAVVMGQQATVPLHRSAGVPYGYQEVDGIPIELEPLP